MPDKMVVMIDGEYCYRPIDHIDMIEGSPTNLIPLLYENEQVFWVLGSTVPRIFKIQSPGNLPKDDYGP